MSPGRVEAGQFVKERERQGEREENFTSVVRGEGFFFFGCEGRLLGEKVGNLVK